MALSLRLKKGFSGFSIDVALDLGNEMAVLFGPSGAGKSTILNMIAGIVRPDSGFVRIDGREVFNSRKGIDLPMRERRIGYLFQDLALFPHMTVFENIAYGLKGRPKGEIEERVKEMLVVMRLVGLEDRYPHEISGGQKQRVALARILVTEPSILLLDEPFTALDYPVREKLRTDLLQIHRRYPVTMLIVTHDQEEAFVLAERMAVINEGRVEQFGTKEEVFYTPRSRQVAKLLGIMNIFDGIVQDVEDRDVVVRHQDLGLVRIARRRGGRRLRKGDRVSFAIRPEEIMILREDRPGRADNPVEGTIVDVVEKGLQNTLYFKTKGGTSLLKIDIPLFAFRKLAIERSKEVTISLKKECIWILEG